MTKKKTCHSCGEEITTRNDSAAHIIPNALGGRLKPKGIICSTCNTLFDDMADNALVEAFGDWPTLLDIPRDRGNNPAKLLTTKKGRKVRLQPNGSLTATDIQYDVNEIPEGHEVGIAAGDMKTVRNLLQRVKKDFPQFDPESAEQHARTVGIDDNDLLKLGFDFSPQAVFGGAITAIWLYLIKMTGRAFMDKDRLLQCITKMQTEGGTFRYLTTGLPGLEGPPLNLCHKIIIRSVPSTGELIAYIEILGILKIGGVFASASPPVELIEHVYVYDLATKTERTDEFSIDTDEFEKQDWRSIGLGPTDGAALRKHFRNSLEMFIDHYQQRFSDGDHG